MQEIEKKEIALENKKLLDDEFKKRSYLKLYSEILEAHLDSNTKFKEENFALL